MWFVLKFVSWLVIVYEHRQHCYCTLFNSLPHGTRELKQTTTTTATKTSPNKKVNGQNNSWHVRYISLYISLPSSAKQERETTKF